MKNRYQKGSIVSKMYGQSPMRVDPTERMMGEPEQYFWGALVKAIPAVLGALGGGGGGAAGGGGGLMGMLSGILGGGKQQQPTAGGQPITINAKMGGAIPSKYKGFSKLPEEVQMKMNPELASQYKEGGSVPNKYKGFSKLPESVQQKISPTLAKQYMNGGMAKNYGYGGMAKKKPMNQEMMYGGAAKRKYFLGSVVKNLLGGM